MSIIGYARVSTPDQSLDAQHDALKNAGAVRVFEDTVSGVKAARPGLDAALDYCREGDTLTVVRLDRLGRKLADLIALTDDLRVRGIAFCSLTEGIDTTTPTGRMMLHVVGAVAEMERELVRERTTAALAAGRARGVKGGRKCALSDAAFDAARAAVDSGMPVREVARIHNIGVSTLHRYLAQAKAREA